MGWSILLGTRDSAIAEELQRVNRVRNEGEIINK